MTVSLSFTSCNNYNEIEQKLFSFAFLHFDLVASPLDTLGGSLLYSTILCMHAICSLQQIAMLGENCDLSLHIYKCCVSFYTQKYYQKSKKKKYEIQRSDFGVENNFYNQAFSIQEKCLKVPRKNIPFENSVLIWEFALKPHRIS